MAGDPADLTTLAQVRAQAPIITTADDSLLQAMITAISRYVYTRTGRRELNGTQNFVDLYDGSGSDKQYVNDWPIQSVTKLEVFNQTIQPSPDGVQPGWIIGDQYASSIVLLPGTSLGGPISYAAYRLLTGRFPKGRQNIRITYTAGFVSLGGPGPHPPSDPTYNGAPTDLGQAVTEFVVQQYKRRDWVDQASKTITQTGENLVFRDWEVPPWLSLVLQRYTRVWLP